MVRHRTGLVHVRVYPLLHFAGRVFDRRSGGCSAAAGAGSNSTQRDAVLERTPAAVASGIAGLVEVAGRLVRWRRSGTRGGWVRKEEGGGLRALCGGEGGVGGWIRRRVESGG